MVQKYFFIIITIVGITVMSCRQDDELNTQNDTKNLLEKKTVGEDQNSSNKSDSSRVEPTFPNDPPKNGTHWKGGDSLNISDDTNDPPKNGTHWKIIDTLNVSDDTNDPPKNGTHWKTGK